MKDSITIEQMQKTHKCRKAFEIMVDNKLCQVWNIENYKHKLGEMNGTPTTWWLDFSGELIPYVDVLINRPCWEIDYKQGNRSKYKWNDWQITSTGRCIIKANGKEVYSFGSHNIAYAMSKAQSLIIELTEHPYNFLNPEEMKGRKIYYYGLPAMVEPSSYPGEISIIPDYEKIEKDEWWELLQKRKNPVLLDDMSDIHKEDLEMDKMDDEEWKDYGKIGHGDALWDGMINWFR